MARHPDFKFHPRIRREAARTATSVAALYCPFSPHSRTSSSRLSGDRYAFDRSHGMLNAPQLHHCFVGTFPRDGSEIIYISHRLDAQIEN
jgi:hypothetical protein